MLMFFCLCCTQMTYIEMREERALCLSGRDISLERVLSKDFC